MAEEKKTSKQAEKAEKSKDTKQVQERRYISITGP